MAMDDPRAAPIKIPDWSGLFAERDRLAAELDAARTKNTELYGVIECVRELHQPVTIGIAGIGRWAGQPIVACTTCGDQGVDGHDVEWPCETRAALDAVPAAETGSSDVSSRCGEPGCRFHGERHLDPRR